VSAELHTERRLVCFPSLSVRKGLEKGIVEPNRAPCAVDDSRVGKPCCFFCRSAGSARAIGSRVACCILVKDGAEKGSAPTPSRLSLYILVEHS